MNNYVNIVYKRGNSATGVDLHRSKIKAKEFYLKCVSLLTLCDTIDIIKSILNDLFKIMLNKDKRYIENNICIVLDRVREKKFKRVSVETEKGQQKKIDIGKLNKYSSAPSRIKSPYFEEIKPNWVARKSTFNNQEDDEINNDLYTPDFGEYIINEFVPMLPFITKIMREAASSQEPLKFNDFIDGYVYEYKHVVLKGHQGQLLTYVSY